MSLRLSVTLTPSRGAGGRRRDTPSANPVNIKMRAFGLRHIPCSLSLSPCLRVALPVLLPTNAPPPRSQTTQTLSQSPNPHPRRSLLQRRPKPRLRTTPPQPPISQTTQTLSQSPNQHPRRSLLQRRPKPRLRSTPPRPPRHLPPQIMPPPQLPRRRMPRWYCLNHIHVLPAYPHHSPSRR